MRDSNAVMSSVDCQFADYSGKNYRRGHCRLGWFGGDVSIVLCQECIKRGDNTPETKAAFDAKAQSAHPGSRPRISGCCDRADQW